MTDPRPAFRIDGELTIYSAAALCAALKDAVAATPAGAPFELDCDGLLAVCVQHEMDHLAGKLFVDYLSPLKREMVRKKLAKRKRA